MTAILNEQFSAPVPSDLVESLVAQHADQLRRCQALASFIEDGYSDAASYFFKADEDRQMRYTRTAAEIFDIEKARPYLDAVFWQRALDLTDIYECMPQARKDEWVDLIQQRKCPEFNEDNVRATIGDLLLMRGKFLAEKADGVFRRLSRDHVTNVPEGFGKRFIMDYCFSYGTANSSAAGYLEDLREVIAKYQGREIPKSRLLTFQVMDYARGECRGQWVEMDGGALKIRCYLKGTMHIEVHPDIAWRLNQLLHSLYPSAIPSKFRNPPKRKPRIPPVHDRPLSFACLSVLRDGISGRSSDGKRWGCYREDNKAALKEAEQVIEQIGGVRDGNAWAFDYDVRDVIKEIIASGVVPDQVAHQFYPTPPEIVEAMIGEAAIVPGHTCLEPSAGTGSIADEIQLFACHEPICIEISPIHCRVLESKGRQVIEADFLEWAEEQDALLGTFDRIVMNPPYSQGRALAHLEAALTLLAPDGRLVALLPATYQDKQMPGNGRWAQTFERFPGTSISVAIYVVEGVAK